MNALALMLAMLASAPSASTTHAAPAKHARPMVSIVRGPVMHCSAPRALASDVSATVRVCEVTR